MQDMRETYVQVLDYIQGGLPDDPIFDWIMHETVARGIPEIQVTPVQGRFLRLMAQLLNARQIVEVGTLSGYSGVWLARMLPSDGRLITLEANEKHAALAREVFARAGVADRTEVIVGPAQDTLANLVLSGPLDMVFIDADKPSNGHYLAWAMAHVRSGGLVIVDNVLANGRVVAASPEDAYGSSINAFNRDVFQRFGELATVIPFYKPDEDNLDGMLVVRVP
ncbi:MAG: O-methyltransferase [Anaerolineae bacterium]